MIRRYFFGFLSLASLLVAVAIIAMPAQLTVSTFLLLATVAALVTLARPSPAAFRDFWQRLTARVRYTVPSTT